MIKANVYIAAPFGRWREAKRAAELLERADYRVNIPWVAHAEKTNGKDELPRMSPEARRGALDENYDAIFSSQVIIGLVFSGEGREMFCEMGAARNFKYRTAIWVGAESDMPLTAFAFNCKIVPTIEAAIALLGEGE